VTDKCR